MRHLQRADTEVVRKGLRLKVASVAVLAFGILPTAAVAWSIHTRSHSERLTSSSSKVNIDAHGNAPNLTGGSVSPPVPRGALDVWLLVGAGSVIGATVIVRPGFTRSAI